jgi:hypothetical protein
MSAVLRDDPPALGLSQALEHVVNRCLAKQRLQRFASMQEVKAALEGLSGSAAAAAPSIAVLPRWRRWLAGYAWRHHPSSRRNRLPAHA